MRYFFQQSLFKVRKKYFPRYVYVFRKLWLKFLGMKVGSRTNLPLMYVTWPHQVKLGKNCKLEHGIFFKYDGIWAEGPAIEIGDNVFIGNNCEFNITIGLTVGNDSLIAAGCRFIDHDHGYELNELMRTQKSVGSPIIVSNNVWLGCNVVVLKGVTISTGAIVAAGAVVTKSIPTNEIWGGVPARKIGVRQ